MLLNVYGDKKDNILNILQNSSPVKPDVNGNRHYLYPKDVPSVYNGHSIDNIIKNFGVNPDYYKK